MGGLELSLIAAALLIGFTGTWSPCGFSMIETIGPTGHSGGRPTTLAACATFFVGCLAGGAATFAALAAIGGLVHGAGGRAAYIAAAAIALAAAVAEARGTRIAPQVRRQLPEHWRWLMPMPVAAGLYGVLLGLGFTTFVLTFGVWALMGIAFAVGEPMIGLAIGLAFGIGRGVPIILLAPVADRPVGARCTEAMAVRPRLYRGARLGDAAALLVAAAVLFAAEPAVADASSHVSHGYADPATQAKKLALQRVSGGADDRGAFMRDPLGANPESTPGNEPAIGGGRYAALHGGEIVIRNLGNLEENPADRRISGQARIDAIAVSKDWVAYRMREGTTDRLVVRRIRASSFGPARVIDRLGSQGQLGQPDLHNNLLVYARATQAANQILRHRLDKNNRGVLVSSRTYALSNPSVLNRTLVYVRTTRERHQLLRRAIGNRGWGVSLFARRPGRGTLWSTALGPNHAFVTVLQGTTSPSAQVRRLSR